MYTSNEPEILHENGVKKSLNEKFRRVEQIDFKNRSIKRTKCTKKYVAASNNVYLKLSVAA